MNISVCVATYNGEKFIHEQIDSILRQLSTEDEVIVSDDSSTDNTLKIVASFNDNRIKIFPNNKFRSATYNFEFALNKAKGDYIFLSDQDDVWMENKVEIMIKALARADLVLSDCSIVDDQLNMKTKSYFDSNNSGKGLIKNLVSNSYNGGCMAFKKKVLNKALPFPKKIPMHDMWLGFIGELFFKVEFLHQPLILHRRHDNNASTTSGRSSSSVKQKFIYRWNLVKNIPKLLLR